MLTATAKHAPQRLKGKQTGERERESARGGEREIERERERMAHTERVAENGKSE